MYIKLIIVGIGLFLFYRLASFLNKKLHFSIEIKHYTSVLLPFAELFSWLGFSIWSIRLIYESEAYITLIVLGILILLLVIPSWFLIRDFLFGALLVIQRKIELNNHIEIGDIAGEIVKIDHFTFDLKSKDGNIDTIPYSKIKSKVISKSGDNIHLEKQLISFRIPAQENIDNAIDQFKMTLINSPWVAASQQPIIKNINRENEVHIIDVFVYVLKKEYTEKIREYVNRNFRINPGS